MSSNLRTQSPEATEPLTSVSECPHCGAPDPRAYGLAPITTPAGLAYWIGDQLTEDLDAWELDREQPGVLRLTLGGRDFKLLIEVDE